MCYMGQIRDAPTVALWVLRPGVLAKTQKEIQKEIQNHANKIFPSTLQLNMTS